MTARIFTCLLVLIAGGCAKLELTRQYQAPWFCHKMLKDACVVIAPPVSRDRFIDHDDLQVDLSGSLRAEIKVGEVISQHYVHGDLYV